MYTIVEKEYLSPDIILIRVAAERIAKRYRSGQFVMVRVTKMGERIPLTVYNYNAEEGWIELVYQIVGLTTGKMAELNVGDALEDIAGPLGRPADLYEENNILAIAGGVGIAPLMAQMRDYRGRNITIIYGARDAEHLVLQAEVEELFPIVHYYTDDGSAGKKGFVTSDLEQLIRDNNYDRVLAIGPIPMMEAVVGITRKFNLPTEVSLNPIMVDGTGMCGGCRVTIGTETKLACVDGPGFDGLLVDFKELRMRNSMYDKGGRYCERQ